MAATVGGTDGARTARRGSALLLALPTALWYLLFLIAPLVVLVVMSVGERSPNGGYAPGFTLEQYAALPTRFTPLINTLGLARAQHRDLRRGGVPRGVHARAQGPGHVEARPRRAGGRPVLDELPHPDVRLDDAARRKRHPARAGMARVRGHPAAQHALRGLAGDRLQLPAADGPADLRQPRAARPLVPRGVARSRGRADRHAAPDRPAARRARASCRASCWSSSR